MGRFPQPADGKGSLKWIQRAINDPRWSLDRLILPRLPGASQITWRSPLASDGFAEYRDRDFLERIGLSRLSGALGDYWPQRGPQWDALATTDSGGVLLVEAKAHAKELCGPPMLAENVSSRALIASSLDGTIKALKAVPRADWSACFYQLANRIAHLRFLREAGTDASLVLVNFVGDKGMSGPESRTPGARHTASSGT